MSDADVIVVGAGASGLATALFAAEHGLTVVLIAKPRSATGGDASTATAYAQGGIAAVTSDAVTSDATDDSFGRHLSDTVIAGAGLTDEASAMRIVSDGPAVIEALRHWGMRFDADAEGRIHRTREGGHSIRRIMHAGGDSTGMHIQRVLEQRMLRYAENGSIVLREGTVSDLARRDGRVVGVVLNPNPEVVSAAGSTVVTASTTVLATGGSGHLYWATTNPLAATGDGVALALMAGARVADLEFVQFHPTMLYRRGSAGRCALISEAVRGEGGVLRDCHGQPIMRGVHSSGDLAPRDIVARAVAETMRRTGADHVVLDTSLVSGFSSRFPTITAAVRAAGLRERSIPVVPGAHYQCGGVVVDADAATAVPGLLAVGEVARTGMHGANRLASNSLLEAISTGRRAARTAADRAGMPVASPEPHPPAGVAIADRTWLQQSMSQVAGVVRRGDELADLVGELHRLPMRYVRTTRDVQDRALTVTAKAVIAAALARNESRGAHTRADYPAASTAESRVFALSAAGDAICEIGRMYPAQEIGNGSGLGAGRL